MRNRKKIEQDEMPAEFDLDALGPPVRGKYYALATAKFPVVRLAPDVAKRFANESEVNNALRKWIGAEKPKNGRTKPAAARRARKTS